MVPKQVVLQVGEDTTLKCGDDDDVVLFFFLIKKAIQLSSAQIC